MSEIGTLNEKPLHEALKRWYAQPGDRFEVPVDGFVVDIVRGDLLIEIQTRNFSAIRSKLKELVTNHPVRLVYPIAAEKWIVRLDHKDLPAGRRRSPKRGVLADIFDELIYLPGLFASVDFSLELLLIREEEVRRFDGVRGWRRGGWVTAERRLLEVIEHHVLATPADLRAFLPPELDGPFTTADLAAGMKKPARLARKMAYCLRSVGCITVVGKRANSIVYVAKPLDSPVIIDDSFQEL